jgi:transcriptional regulator with XRE-family HTH domain
MRVMDHRPLRKVVRELGIRLEELSDRSGVDQSYISKQLRGERPMLRAVMGAIADALDQKAVACLTFTAVLLRRHGEPEAAEVCERLWERIGATPVGAPSPGEVRD